MEGVTVFKSPLVRILECPFNTSSALREQDLFRRELTVLFFGEGITNITVGTRTVTAKPGDTVLIDPFTFHAILTHTGQRSDRYYAISIAPEFILNMREGSYEARYLTVTSGIRAEDYFPEGHQLADIVRLIISELKRQRIGFPFRPDEALHRFFRILLADRFRLPESIPIEKALRYCRTVEPALEKIRTAYSERITVEALAELCGISKFHFCRIFKLVTQVSPLLYLSQYRLKIAQAMLLHTNDPIMQISGACGFEDTAYFCRAFKKQFLFSAQKYRLLHTSPRSLEILSRKTEEALLLQCH